MCLSTPVYHIFTVFSVSPSAVPVMALNAPHRLSQTVRHSVCMERTGSMRMEDNHNAALRVFRAVKAPIMPRVSGSDRHIVNILVNDVEILRIQISQIIRIKHWQPPFRSQPMQPTPSRSASASLQASVRPYTCYTARTVSAGSPWLFSSCPPCSP